MRKHELLLLKQLRYNRQITDTEFHSILEKENCYIDDDVLISVDRVLSLEFYLPKNQKDPNKENQKIDTVDEILCSMSMEYIEWMNN